ncbi:MAG: biotin--[acetyl-CoA-carboxylase] ligase [Clostridiales Family XIII bacterium]|jgi:BirA family biotin operon repressor/biotin-[acetyl-CoA-carboxylase] ligase|nr:biotin--[acetyl-CoA-carboxylase] ligase [Clostridiales Family XIII bacterium]
MVSRSDNKITYFGTIDSTNNEARRRITAGAFLDDLNGTVLVASKQTAGRGRHGREFLSLSNRAIYISFILRADGVQLLTVAAAVAVCRALDKVDIEGAQIKWVNDIIIDERKICGILAETVSATGNPDDKFAVLGIGVNVNVDEEKIPAELVSIAGGISMSEEKRVQLIHAIIDEVTGECYEAPVDTLLEEYRRRSMLINRAVTVHNLATKEKTPATAISIADDGGLKVRYEDGTTEILNSGEVSVRT